MKRHLALVLSFAVALPLGLPAQSGQEPLKFPNGALAMRKLKTASVLYPEEAKKQRIQGTVSFRAVIGRNGTVQSLIPIDGPPELVQGAKDAVKQWTYEPYVVDGQPQVIQTILQINFAFPDQREPVPLWMQEYRRVPPFEMAGHLRTMVDPTRSPAGGSKGVVTVSFIVDEHGDVKQADATHGPPELYERACNAVLQWKYTPYLIQGRPAAVISRAVFDFE